MLFGMGIPLPVQNSPAPRAASSPAKSIGMLTFLKNGRNGEQQAKGENECYAAAHQQSGVDPQAPPPAAKSPDQKAAEQKAAADSAKQPKGGRVRGAAFSACMRARGYSVK